MQGPFCHPGDIGQSGDIDDPRVRGKGCAGIEGYRPLTILRTAPQEKNYWSKIMVLPLRTLLCGERFPVRTQGRMARVFSDAWFKKSTH